MDIEFVKYHGAGNDFIMIDNRNKIFEINHKIIKRLSDRHWGIGADGLIILEKDNNLDFYMRYFNADGYEGSMCGNGGRCVIFFAHNLNIINKKARFNAIDGEHSGEIISFSGNKAIVNLEMNDVTETSEFNGNLIIDTGSPHYLIFCNSITEKDVFTEGKKIRKSEPFKKDGINVNFIEKTPHHIKIRTYERGVENETLACGTGIVAAAIANYLISGTQKEVHMVETLGGMLKVNFKYNKGLFTDIYLEGPAEFVFTGKINI